MDVICNIKSTVHYTVVWSYVFFLLYLFCDGVLDVALEIVDVSRKYTVRVPKRKIVRRLIL